MREITIIFTFIGRLLVNSEKIRIFAQQKSTFMKKISLFVLFCLCLAGCRKSPETQVVNGDNADVLVIDGTRLPAGAIPFIFEKHIYLHAVLNDSVEARLVYDTGADYLYLDEDYVRIGNLQNAFGRTIQMNMGGAGNGAPVQVDVITDPVSIRMGQHVQKSRLCPIIRLRDIIGCHADGLLGNLNFLSKPLQVSFSNHYMLPLDEIPADMPEGYTRLNARYQNQRIYIEATLNIDEKNAVNGLFLLDMGSGGGITLTQAAYSLLDLSKKPKVFFHTQAGGIGGASDDMQVRAQTFVMADTLENLVINCSLNTQGALSEREYVGLIGAKILSLYDIIFDPQHEAVYYKRIQESQQYSGLTKVQMSFFDRTDICDGWVVNGLYMNGIAQKVGIGIGDIILSVNGRPVKEMTWEEQRSFQWEGKTTFVVKKENGKTKEYVLDIDKEII